MSIVPITIKQKSDRLLTKYFTGESMDYKMIFGITFPILVDQAFLVLMSLLNTAMISSSGVAAVSAVSMVDSLNIFLINVFIAVATGGTVMVAQYKGKGDAKMVSKTSTQAISAVSLFSLLLGAIVIIFHMPLLDLLFGNAEADVLENAKIYIVGSAISYPLIGVFQAVGGSLRGVGETKPYLKLSLLINLTNTILNVLLISVFHMGIVGLVISTISARSIGMVASLIYIIKINETIRLKVKEALHFDFSILRKIMFIGLPFAAEQIFFNGGKLLTQTFIVELGTLALTVYAIANAILMLFQIAPNAIGISIITVVGQCIGKKNVKDARKFTKSLIGLSSIMFVVAALIILPLYPLIIELFNPPAEIISTIFLLLLIAGITQPFLWSISFTMPSALRAAGDSKFTFISSLITMWTLRVVLGYILGITLGFGITGVWIAMIIEWVARGAIFVWRFKGDKWYAHNLV